MIEVQSPPKTAGGEFPYGTPPDEEVALASGAVRILMQFAQAVESGQTGYPTDTDHEDLAIARYVAQSRLSRAVIGSMSIVGIDADQLRARHLHIPCNGDTETPTGAIPAIGAIQTEAEAIREGDEAEAIVAHDQIVHARTVFADKLPYSVAHEDILRAAIAHVAAYTQEPWQEEEAYEVAQSRGYFDLIPAEASATPV